MTKQVFQTTFAGRELIVETGQVAKQANGSVVVRYGESTVLTAAVMSKKMATGDFFPLQVNYEEKMYAAGKFPGVRGTLRQSPIFIRDSSRPLYPDELNFGLIS